MLSRTISNGTFFLVSDPFCLTNDFASIARPLTDILNGDNGKVSSSQSKTIQVSFYKKLCSAFEKLQDDLAFEIVMLLYPDYEKPLSTDASALCLGAVLSQDGQPITMISRTLQDKELNFATNKRELLVIVWTLQSLKNYLYGVQN